MNHKSLEYFKTLFSSSTDAMGYVDLNGVFLDVNNAFTVLTQYSKKELLSNKKYTEITPKEYFELENQLVQRMLNNYETVEYEKELIRKDGSRIPVGLNSFAITDRKGRPVALGGIVRDLSEQKQLQEKVGEYESRYLTLLKSSSDTVCEMDSNGIFLNVGPNSREILDHDPAELIGKDIFRFIHTKDVSLFRSKFIKSFKTLSTQKVKFRMLARDSAWSIIEGEIRPYSVSNTSGRSILIFKNLTSENSIRYRVRKQTDELKSLNQDLELKEKDLNILYSVAKAVHESIDIEDVCRISMDKIIELDNVDMVMIYIVDHSRKVAELKQSRNVPEKYIKMAHTIPYPKGVTWHIINTAEHVNTEDVQKSPRIGPAGKELGHHGLLGIPLLNRCEVNGVIFFTTYKSREFNSKEVRLLSSISEHISIAMAKANLYKELSRKTRYETIINTVTRSIHKSINLQEILDNAVNSIKKNIINADKVAIYLIQGDRAVLNAYEHTTVKYKKEISDKDGVTWETIRSGNVNYISGLENKPVIDFTKWKFEINSYLGLPIRSENRIIGILTIASTKADAFDEQELNLFNIIINQIEIALKNAKMVEALEQSEKKYRDLFENIPTGIYRKDKSGRIIMANPALANMLGYSTFEELIAHNLKRDEFDLNYNESKFKRAIKNEGDFYGLDIESTWKRKDGTFFDVLENVKAVYDDRGDISYYEGTVKDITERKQAENKLRNSEQRLRDLAIHLQSIREDERKKIAREIHDEFAQQLTGMMISLSMMKKDIHGHEINDNYSKIISNIDDLSHQVKHAVQTAKRITGKLRPRILDDMGIEAAIQWQIDNVRKVSDIEIRFYSGIKDPDLDQDLATALFRIFQESITNILRHSEAKKVRVSLRENNNSIMLRVSDNGRGIKESETSNLTSFGLLGIRERVIPFNGEVNILGKPGKGTCIEVTIPLKR